MPSSRPSLTHDELRLLYQVTVSDLAYFKTQQWSVTNYTLLLFAGILGIAQLIRPLSLVDRWALAALAVGAGCGSLFVLSKVQRSIRTRQARLEVMREEFSSTFRKVWAADIKGREFLHAINFLFAVIACGAIVVCWLALVRL